MDDIIENNGEVQFANGQSNRDLRASSGNLHERTDSSAPLEALRTDSDKVRDLRIELPDGPRRKSATSGGSPWYRRSTKRVGLLVLLVLAVGAVLPFAWNYLQSYESTDDAQIDGHRSTEFAHQRDRHRRPRRGQRPGQGRRTAGRDRSARLRGRCALKLLRGSKLVDHHPRNGDFPKVIPL
jgi:hypothetical protein